MKTLLAVILISLPMLAADPAWETAAVKAACGPNDITFKANPSCGQSAAQPETGKALVYVVEPYGLVNTLGAPTIRVGLDGSWVGANHRASYLFFSVEVRCGIGAASRSQPSKWPFGDGRSRGDWRPRTSTASCTAISSRRT